MSRVLATRAVMPMPVSMRLTQAIRRSKAPTAFTWTRDMIFQRKLWRRGLAVVWFMVRNVTAALIWTWLLVWLCSRGNVFSGLSSRHQSYGVFMGGATMWIQLAFCLLTLVGQSAVLKPCHFPASPDPRRPPGFVFCFRLLVKHTYLVVAVSMATPLGLAMLADCASASTRLLHLEFYLNCILSALFFTVVHLVRRQIYFKYTTEGALKQSCSRRTGSSVSMQQQSHQRRARRQNPFRFTRFCRVFLMQNLPLLFSTFIAGLFVQVSSFIHIKTRWQLMAYAGGSLAFKLAIQELARIVISSQKSTKDTRTIFLTVGLPTVLIDTQIRLAMQRLNSVQVTVSGAVILSLLEVFSRVGKVLYLRIQFRRYDARHATATNQARAMNLPSTQLEALEKQQHEWKQLHLRYHAAEVYADMSAEYIAIGSCAAMILFYWEHPHYMLGGTARVGGNLIQPILWLAQVGLEIVIDYVSVVLELAGGIPFEELYRSRSFITLLFLIIALLNVQNSAVFFLIGNDN